MTSTDADCPHKRIIMKVYSDRNVTNIDFIAVGIFQVGQQFMKLGSLLYMRCRHRSVKSRALRSNKGFRVFLFQQTKNADSYGIVL